MLLTFWSLVIDVYTGYLIEGTCIKILFMNYCRMFVYVFLLLLILILLYSGMRGHTAGGAVG